MIWCPGPLPCPEEVWGSLPRIWILQAAEMRAETGISETECFLSASKVSSQGAGQGSGEGEEPASTWVSWFQSTHSDCSLGLFEEQCHLELLALNNTKFMLCWQCPFH